MFRSIFLEKLNLLNIPVCKASKQLEECQSENIALSMKYKTPESLGESSAVYAGDNASVEIIRVSSEDAALVK